MNLPTTPHNNNVDKGSVSAYPGQLVFNSVFLSTFYSSVVCNNQAEDVARINETNPSFVHSLIPSNYPSSYKTHPPFLTSTLRFTCPSIRVVTDLDNSSNLKD